MKTLVSFALNKRFNNRMTIIMNILVFAVIGLIVHVDHLMGFNGNNKVVCLDSSMQKYQDRFLAINHDEFNYQVAEEGDILLHYDGTWTLHTDKKADERLVEAVQKDITDILSAEYYETADVKVRSYIDEYRNIQLTNLYETEESDNNPVWILLSVIYFIILSYGNLIANEVVYEKATNTLNLILTAVDEREHFFAKITTAYLSLVIQAMVVFVEGVFWIFIRYREDKLKGIISLLMSYVQKNEAVEILPFPTGNIIIICLFVLVGIVTLQTIMLIVFSGFSNSDDVGNCQGPMYVIMVIGYYYLLIKGSKELFTSLPSVIMSFVPILSMIFMPCRLAVDNVSVMEIMTSLTISIISFTMVIRFGLPVYKRNLLRNNTERKWKPLVRKLLPNKS